jgi:hypothetical protein
LLAGGWKISFELAALADRASDLYRHHAALDWEISRAEGEDLRDPETALSCPQVFAALGGLKGEADAANFAVRGLLAKSVAEAARRLERRYGKDALRTAYDKLSDATLAAALSS